MSFPFVRPIGRDINRPILQPITGHIKAPSGEVPFSLNQTNENTFEIDGATGDVTVTVTSPGVYSSYDAGNGAGVFIFDEADLASGPWPLVPPQIIDDGTPEDGDTLTLTPGLWTYDPDNGGLGSPSYQWQRNGVNIAGATTLSYTLMAADAGTDIRVIETLADNNGTRTAASAAVSVESGAVVVDPEAELTQDETIAVGASKTFTGVQSSASVVMACDFTGLDGSAGGIILESGGGGLGVFVGFNPDGTFVVRCGNGGDSSTAWPTGTAYIEMSSGQPSGDGTLVWEFDVSTDAIRVWWNGVEIGTPSGSFTGSWTGSDGGSYMGTSVGSSPTGGSPGEHGLDNPAVVTNASASALRLYYGEVSAA